MAADAPVVRVSPRRWLRLRRLATRLLRGDTRVLRQAGGRGEAAALVLGVGACLMGYGALMATFDGLGMERWVQMVYSALKVPILLAGTAAVSLPSYFVIQTLLGLRDDIADSLRALLAAQAVVAMTLIALAPLTLLWYASSTSYSGALVWNMAVFGVASLAGQVALRRFYRPLIARNPLHRRMLRLWIGVFAFTGIQLAWMLRPFVGAPGEPVVFVREGGWGNAYLEVLLHVLRALGVA